MRNTGFSPATREVIHSRSEGVCEAMIPCVCTGRVEQIHHRRPRGAGGTRKPDANLASNSLALCSACHLFIETHRTEAIVNGWLVSNLTNQSPRDVGVLYRGHAVLFLTDDGGFAATPTIQESA